MIVEKQVTVDLRVHLHSARSSRHDKVPRRMATFPIPIRGTLGVMMNTLVHISVSMKYLSYISSAKSLGDIPEDHDRAPTSNERRPRRSQEQSMYRDEEDEIPDVVEDEYPESYSGKSFGNGKTKASVQRPSRSKSRPRVVGVHSSPPSVVDSPIVQRMDSNTRQGISQATKRTQSQWLVENDKQSMTGNTMDEEDDSDNSGHFSSHDIDEQG